MCRNLASPCVAASFAAWTAPLCGQLLRLLVKLNPPVFLFRSELRVGFVVGIAVGSLSVHSLRTLCAQAFVSEQYVNPRTRCIMLMAVQPLHNWTFIRTIHVLALSACLVFAPASL